MSSSIMQQLTDVVKNFYSIVESIEKGIDSTDWNSYRKSLAHSILLRLPTPNEISTQLVTTSSVAFLNELKIRVDVLNIFKTAECEKENQKIFTTNDYIEYAATYVEDLLSDMNAFSQMITFKFSGYDATHSPTITYYICLEI